MIWSLGHWVIGHCAVALAVLLAWLAAAPDAYGCTCISRGCGVVSQGAVLFEATVNRITPATPSEPLIVEFTDIRMLRGGPAPLTVLGGDGVNCGYRFRVGVRYFIEAEPSGQVSMCSQTRPLAAAQGLLELLSAPAGAERPRIWGRVSADDVKGRGLGWPGGPPVDGAIVTFDGPVRVLQRTGPNGEFSFHGVPAGQYRASVTIPRDRADVYAPAPTEVTLAAEAACVNVDLVAPSSARVTGTVVDPAGRPQAGVFVELFPAPFDEWGASTVRGATSGEGGRFVIERLPPGRYVGGVGVPYPRPREAIAPALARTATGSAILDVEPGASLEIAPIVAVPAPRVTIRGRIIAPPGVPAGSRTIVLQPIDGLGEAAGIEAGTTSPDGSFVIEANRGVRYRVLVEDRPSVVVGRTEFVAGDGTLEIRLDPPR